MNIINQFFRNLVRLGMVELEKRLREDYSRSDAFWHNHQCNRHKLCAFLNTYLEQEDTNARMTLYPHQEDKALLIEIFTDVVPVLRGRLGI